VSMTSIKEFATWRLAVHHSDSCRELCMAFPLVNKKRQARIRKIAAGSGFSRNKRRFARSLATQKTQMIGRGCFQSDRPHFIMKFSQG